MVGCRYQWAELPGGSGQHSGVWAEMAEADWSIITDLTAEVVQILKRRIIQLQWTNVDPRG